MTASLKENLGLNHLTKLEEEFKKDEVEAENAEVGFWGFYTLCWTCCKHG